MPPETESVKERDNCKDNEHQVDFGGVALILDTPRGISAWTVEKPLVLLLSYLGCVDWCDECYANAHLVESPRRSQLHLQVAAAGASRQCYDHKNIRLRQMGFSYSFCNLNSSATNAEMLFLEREYYTCPCLPVMSIPSSLILVCSNNLSCPWKAALKAQPKVSCKRVNLLQTCLSRDRYVYKSWAKKSRERAITIIQAICVVGHK